MHFCVHTYESPQPYTCLVEYQVPATGKVRAIYCLLYYGGLRDSYHKLLFLYNLHLVSTHIHPVRGGTQGVGSHEGHIEAAIQTGDHLGHGGVGPCGKV